ncbi:MAG: hypothetical protein ACKE9I_04360 [Methylophagaceae bacterium]
MDIARYTEDGDVYYIEGFAHLPSEELAQKRRFLQCAECGGPAYFRKASRSGQAACFGARPHKPGCSFATPEHSLSDDGQGDEQDRLINSGETIVIDLNFESTSESQTKAKNIDGTPSSRRRLGSFLGDGSRPESKMHRRLSSLLLNLTGGTNFHESNQILEIEGYPDMTVKDFFVPIEKISNEDVGSFRGLWGMLSCANTKPRGSLWLNGSGQNTINFCLDNRLIGHLFKKYGIEEDEELSGAYILVLGIPLLSPNDTLYCAIKDLSHVTLRLAK